MTTKTLLLIVLLAVPASAVAQASQPRPRPENRQALEAQIFNRFLDRVSNEMALDAQGRQRLRTHLQESGERRRALAQRTVALRRELMQAIRNDASSDEQYTRIVNELSRLRREEQNQWDADHQALARTLTPRQQAIFILEWTRFQDRIREVASQRPGGPPRRQP